MDPSPLRASGVPGPATAQGKGQARGPGPGRAGCRLPPRCSAARAGGLASAVAVQVRASPDRSRPLVVESKGERANSHLAAFAACFFSHLCVSGDVCVFLRATGCAWTAGLCETCWLAKAGRGRRRLKLHQLSISWSSKLRIAPEDGNK